MLRSANRPDRTEIQFSEQPMTGGDQMKVETLNKKRLLDGFVAVDEVTYRQERFDGQMSQKTHRQIVERRDAAAALLIKPDSLTFVRQFRYPTHDKGPGWMLELVAGVIDPGEDAETAIRREIIEETGYQTQSLAPISTFYPSPGTLTERIVLFAADITNADKIAKGGGVAEESEDIEVVDIPIADIPNLLNDGSIQDAKTIIGLQWFLLNQ
jgi:nudix-type nucleoside diphosphatase (YffH/AdpP family)